jgi:hypothetical protein
VSPSRQCWLQVLVSGPVRLSRLDDALRVVRNNTRMCWSCGSWEVSAQPALPLPSTRMPRAAFMPLDAMDDEYCALPAKRIVGGQIAYSMAVSERHARPALGTMLAASAVCPWLSVDDA